MDSSSIQLLDSKIEYATITDGKLRVRFSEALIIKTMTGSSEKTMWKQVAELVIDGAEAEAPLPPMPAVCSGGDIEDNIYVYRDMIPVPFSSRGRCRCDLSIRGSEERLMVSGDSIRLEMESVPKYIRHIRG